MEPRLFHTPQKTSTKLMAGLMHQYAPENSCRSQSETPKSNAYTRAGNYSKLPVISTPPSRFPKVTNPFESGLAERLHLPLICSPSLFQRANTPQHSSTQFEWTIEEVSSLGPANVEAHETQFQATPDPDMEAKAQAAISSYFKEQIIVPSPVECQLRNRKIPMDNLMSNDSPPVRSGRRIRDGVAQTVMSIPPVVAPEIENILKIFLTYNGDQQQSPTVSCDITLDCEAQDISLRRKLFGLPLYYVKDEKESSDRIHDEDASVIETERSPPPKTPDLQTDPIPMRGFGNPFGNDSFGAISPISKANSPKFVIHDRTLNITDDMADEDFNFGNDSNVLISTKQSPHNTSDQIDINDFQQNQSLYRSTPDRSIAFSSVVNMSIDSSLKKNAARNTIANSSRNLFPNDFEHNELEHSFLVADEDDMQISQLSAKSTSSSSSSQHSDTPMRRGNRSARRKNLSRSFSCPVTDDEDEMDRSEVLLKKVAAIEETSCNETGKQQQSHQSTYASYATSVLYRADSGFNETTTQDESKFRIELDCLKRSNVVIIEADVSMSS